MTEKFVLLETENLFLKPISLSDNNFVYQHFSNDDVCRFLVDIEPFTDIKEAEALITWYSTPEPRDYNRWIVFKKADNEPIGTCGYHRWNKKDNTCEIGYDLSRAFWGKGYMTEAVSRALRFGFEKMNLNRIEAFVHVQNDRSANLLKKMGFTQEGIIRDKHLFRGKYYDHFCFSLLKRDWNI